MRIVGDVILGLFCGLVILAIYAIIGPPVLLNEWLHGRWPQKPL
jgi:hypothetical protein